MNKQSYHKPEFLNYGKISTMTAANGSMTVADNPGAPSAMNKSAVIP
jgi:hypothetical protein